MGVVTVTGKSRLGRLFGKDGSGYEPQVVMQMVSGKSVLWHLAISQSPKQAKNTQTHLQWTEIAILLRSTQNRPEPLRSDKNPGKIAPKMAQNRSIYLSHLLTLELSSQSRVSSGIWLIYHF